jgi:hypothetical protein
MDNLNWVVGIRWTTLAVKRGEAQRGLGRIVRDMTRRAARPDYLTTRKRSEH